MRQILLTNDDGFSALGIQRAAEALHGIAELTIVAPEKQQSAVSHKITLHKPLRMKEHPSELARLYASSGSPADCVKLALTQLFPEKKPDLIVSGINQGNNSGYNLFYSGTVAAAVEGMINGIPSIAISLSDHHFSDFSLSQSVLKEVVQGVFKNSLEDDIFLNINVPPVHPSECQGVEFCHVSKNRYTEAFQVKQNPHGENYYWLGGKRLEIDTDKHADDLVIQKNKVAIAPVKFDFNRDGILDTFKSWDIEI